MYGVSVCIAAYNAHKYIKECLDSIAQQSWFQVNQNYEILIGIDNCQKTLRQVKKIMKNYKNLRVFMMRSNEGAYITINSLFYLAKYDYVVRFDADDIMHSNCIQESVSMMSFYDYVRFKFRNFYEDTEGRRPEVQIGHAIGMFRKNVIHHYGYFRPWRCSADTEMLRRLRKFIRVGISDGVLFSRRICKESLTTNEKTGMQSPLRTYYKRFIEKSYYPNSASAIIQCVTNSYDEVYE